MIEAFALLVTLVVFRILVVDWSAFYNNNYKLVEDKFDYFINVGENIPKNIKIKFS